jgi:hypothetical protein
MSAPNPISSSEQTVRKKPYSGPFWRQTDGGPQPVASGSESREGTDVGTIRYRVDELLQGGREAILVHRGQEYRLRITSTGKLILTK